jgi:hydroxyacylglutathione hydrolase
MMKDLISFTGGLCQTNGWVWPLADQRVLLFDAPDDILPWLQAEKIQVAALLLTHHHFDHVLHAGRIASAYQCPIYAYQAPTRDLWLKDHFERMTGWELRIDDYVVTPLAGRSELELEGLTFQLHHVPGHSPDSLCFYEKSSERCIVGDTVMCEGVGRSDFPGGSHTQLIEHLLEKIISLPPSTRLYPGHGPDTTVAHEREHNPYLTSMPSR